MTENIDLVEIVKKAASEIDGKLKLPCDIAFELAEKYNVKRLDIARVCNQHNVRINKCQLGCFK